MKAALIAPKGYERTVLESDIHLILPIKDTLHNLDYLKVYLEANNRGDYIILDNGCAEGQLVSTQTLQEVAHVFGADEVVAPDVMDDYEGTRTLVPAFLNEFEGDYRIMGVLQAQTWDEREALIQYYVSEPRITAIGIPKVNVNHWGDNIRARIARWIQTHYAGRFDIHLLGASSKFVDELDLIKFPKGIRSTDSALPYKLAVAGGILGERSSHVKRWPTYFSEKEETSIDLVERNIRTYMRWAASHK